MANTIKKRNQRFNKTNRWLVFVFVASMPTWLGPYQLAELLCFWVKKVPDEHGFKHKPDWVHDFGEWLAGKDDHDTKLTKFLHWVQSKRKRKEYVHIDEYDTWNMDSTLALIILPMLKQLKETKHGSANVENEDVPEYLRSTNNESYEQLSFDFYHKDAIDDQHVFISKKDPTIHTNVILKV